MFTPRKGNSINKQSSSADPFVTPQKNSQTKSDHSTAGTFNPASGSSQIHLFGLTSPWETTSGK